MISINEFILLLNGTPTAYFVNGTVLLLCINAAASTLFENKKVSKADLYFSVKEYNFQL